jgi:hypothetical protein
MHRGGNGRLCRQLGLELHSGPGNPTSGEGAGAFLLNAGVYNAILFEVELLDERLLNVSG